MSFFTAAMRPVLSTVATFVTLVSRIWVTVTSMTATVMHQRLAPNVIKPTLFAFAQKNTSKETG